MSAATPDVAALLAQLGAGGAQPPTQPDPGAAAPPAPEETGDHLDLLRQMIQDAQAFIATAPHDQDKAVVAQCLAQYQKLLGQHEQEQHQAMQGKPSPRQLARAASQSQGGAYWWPCSWAPGQ